MQAVSKNQMPILILKIGKKFNNLQIEIICKRTNPYDTCADV